jgi:hypothetical protein
VQPPWLEVPGLDVRDLAAREPAQRHEDVVRVPTAGETVDALAGARRALSEINARDGLDAQEQAEHRAAELARWHADDVSIEQQQAADDVAELAPSPTTADR